FNFVSINPAFSRITGYDEADVTGSSLALLDGTQHDTIFYRQLRERISTQGYWSGELWLRRRNGDEFLCAFESSCVHDGDGNIALHVVVLNDITRQKRAEQELRYLADYDTLTDLPNRSLLSDRLSRAVLRAQREDC